MNKSTMDIFLKIEELSPLPLWLDAVFCGVGLFLWKTMKRKK